MNQKLTDLQRALSRLNPSTYEEMKRIEKDMEASEDRVNKKTREQMGELMKAIEDAVFSEPLLK